MWWLLFSFRRRYVNGCREPKLCCVIQTEPKQQVQCTSNTESDVKLARWPAPECRGWCRQGRDLRPMWVRGGGLGLCPAATYTAVITRHPPAGHPSHSHLVTQSSSHHAWHVFFFWHNPIIVNCCTTVVLLNTPGPHDSRLFLDNQPGHHSTHSTTIFLSLTTENRMKMHVILATLNIAEMFYKIFSDNKNIYEFENKQTGIL